MTRNNFARLGGLIALVSVLILPLASCGEVRLRGADILSMETRPGVKLLVVMAGLAAVLAIFIVNRWAQLLFGLIGIAEFIYVAGGLVGRPVACHPGARRQLSGADRVCDDIFGGAAGEARKVRNFLNLHPSL